MEQCRTYLSGTISTPFDNEGFDTYPLGLYDGCAGMMINDFLLYRYTCDEAYLQRSHQLLEHIFANIGGATSINFADGVTGIGWAVEFLAQQGFLDLNTNELLEDVDGVLYNLVVFSDEQPVSIGHGLLGRMLYFRKRLTHINKGVSRFRDLMHQECQVILSDEINRLLLEKEGAWLVQGAPLTDDQLTDLADVLLVCSHRNIRHINLMAIDSMLSAIISHALGILKHLPATGIPAERLMALCRLSYGGMLACGRRGDKTGEALFSCYLKKCYQQLISIEQADAAVLHLTALLQTHPGEEQTAVEDILKHTHLPVNTTTTPGLNPVIISTLSSMMPELISWEELLLLS